MLNSFKVVEIVTSNNTNEIASSVGIPSINDGGLITFLGYSNSNEGGIYQISSNGTLETVVTNNQLQEGSLTSIVSFNNENSFLYLISFIGPPLGVGNIDLVLNQNGTTTTVDRISQNRQQSVSYQNLSINENNFAVAKTGVFGPGLSLEEIILINSNGTQESIALSFGSANNVTRLTDLGDVALNNQNVVAYAATKTTFDEFGRPVEAKDNIFLTNNITVTLNNGVKAGDLALNDSGLLVYSTNNFTETGNRGEIWQLQGDNTTSLANTDGLFGSFAEISLNNQEEIVFTAFLDDGREAIFAGFDPNGDRIIAVGDTLSNSTVTDLDFSQEGLNNSGLITFKAELANGTLGIYQVNIRDRYMPNIINGTTRSDNLLGTTENDLINGRAGKDTIQGLAGDDTISGGTGNDLLQGGNGSDQITGNSGKDSLDGGLGNDTLVGSVGDDFFVLTGQGSDLISDYKDKQDKFILSSGLKFDELTLVQNDDNTQIQLTATAEILATVNAVMVNQLNSEDFIVAEI